MADVETSAPQSLQETMAIIFPNVGFKRTAERVRLKDWLGQQRKSELLLAIKMVLTWLYLHAASKLDSCFA